MFNDIFKRLSGLIFKPAETWEKLSLEKENRETFLSRYLYPLIGLIALAAFMGILFSRKEFDFEIALKSAIKAVVSTTGGFFLGASLIQEIRHGIFHRPKDTALCYGFTGYASAWMFVLSITLSLLPEFSFLRIVVLYTVYLIWEGATPYMHIREEERLKFTAIASAAIILTPLAIDFLLFLLMPGLRL
ncbi:MAG: YIP1 family protein [Tannerella sp.]|jgi:hypothetical protein|nr:YIP1 family protein [Tannerella sp.]